MDDFFTSDSLTDIDQGIPLGKDIDYKDELNELIQENKQKSLKFDPRFDIEEEFGHQNIKEMNFNMRGNLCVAPKAQVKRE